MNNSDLHLVTQTLLPVLRGMCYHPEALVVKETADPKGRYDKMIVLEPHVVDGGILNGSDSRQLNAIRRVFWLAFNRFGLNVKTELRDNPEGKRVMGPGFKENPEFEKTTGFTYLFASVLNITLDAGYVLRRDDDTPDSKGRPCTTIRISGADPSDVAAIADMFWPFGYRNGRIISIRTQKLNDYNPPLRTSQVPR